MRMIPLQVTFGCDTSLLSEMPMSNEVDLIEEHTRARFDSWYATRLGERNLTFT